MHKHLTATTALLFVTLFCITATAGDKKKFPCPGVPANAEKAEERALEFFDKGMETVDKNKPYGALERFLCSLKMQSDPNTMHQVERVAFAVSPRKDAVKLLIKFKNRNKKNESVADVKALLEALQGSDKPPVALEADPNAERPASAEEATDEAAETAADSDAIEAEPVEPAEPVQDTELTGPVSDNEVKLNDGEVPEKQAVDSTVSISREKKLKGAGIATLVVGLAALGGGAAAQIFSLKAKGEAEDATDYETFQYHKDRADGLMGGAVACYFVGTLGVIVGSVLLAKSKKPLEKEVDEFGDSKVSLSVDAGPTGFLLNGSF